MTAYVVAGLAQAQGRRSAGGRRAHRERRQRGSAKHFAADPKLALDLRAYMQYALVVAGKRRCRRARTGVTSSARSSRPTGWRILGLALEAGQGRARRRDRRRAGAAAQQDAEQAWWTATRDQMLDFSEDATPEATAYAVKFLSHQRPTAALLPKAALWLMNHRNEGYWWSSHQADRHGDLRADRLPESHRAN